MINIPSQLKNRVFRFIRLGKKQKIPIDTDWGENNNYEFDGKILLVWLSCNNNYGLACGYGNSLVLDFDNMEWYEKVKPYLPDTFIVKTGSNKFHYYYQCDDVKSFKIKDLDKKTIIDVQGRGCQVVAPNSIHPTGNEYKVFNDVDIAFISRLELINILKKVFPKEYLPQDFFITLRPIRNPNLEKDDLESIKNNITITDYDNRVKIGSQKCIFHDDDKPSLSIFDNGKAFKCFAGCGEGNIFNYVMLKEKCDFKTALNKIKGGF